MLKGIEDLWRCFDELFEAIEAEGRWNQKHGNDWTFADVPYHMMYFDRELVAMAIERGRNVPEAEQRTQRTIGELNAWNAQQFAKRPAGQTPQQSVADYRAMQERVRQAILSLEDEQMDVPVWFVLVGCGWIPAAASIASCLAHTWSEVIQLRYHMGRSTPEPDPMATHMASGFLAQFMPSFMDKEAAKGTKLTIDIGMTGPGGGDWTMRVADGQCSVSEETAADADLVFSYTPVTAELIRVGKLDFGAAMQSGDVIVQGTEHLPTFGALFPEPSLDKQFEPMGPGARD
jgi:hypothetical protein